MSDLECARAGGKGANRVAAHRSARRLAGSVREALMDDTFRLGRIGGVVVGVHWSVVAILGLLTWSLASRTLPDLASGYPTAAYWAVAFVGAVGLAGSILLHEVCHAVVARRHGIEVDGITLWMFGGLARLHREASDASTELRIALAGPAASVAIGLAGLAVALFLRLLDAPMLLVAAVAWFGAINLLLAAFNLLPGAPLDGGRVLTAILWKRSGDERLARERGARAGRVVGQILIALGVVELALGDAVGGVWMALIGWFLTAAARAEGTAGALASVLEGVHIADVMDTRLHVVAADRMVDDFVHHDALMSRASAFPVVDPLGHPLGLVTLRQIGHLPRHCWSSTRVSAIATAMDHIQAVSPDDLVVDMIGGVGGSDLPALVLAHDRLVGIVTSDDLSAALERHSILQRSPPPARMGTT